MICKIKELSSIIGGVIELCPCSKGGNNVSVKRKILSSDLSYDAITETVLIKKWNLDVNNILKGHQAINLLIEQMQNIGVIEVCDAVHKKYSRKIKNGAKLIAMDPPTGSSEPLGEPEPVPEPVRRSPIGKLCDDFIRPIQSLFMKLGESSFPPKIKSILLRRRKMYSELQDSAKKAERTSAVIACAFELANKRFCAVDVTPEALTKLAKDTKQLLKESIGQLCKYFPGLPQDIEIFQCRTESEILRQHDEKLRRVAQLAVAKAQVSKRQYFETFKKADGFPSWQENMESIERFVGGFLFFLNCLQFHNDSAMSQKGPFEFVGDSKHPARRFSGVLTLLKWMFTTYYNFLDIPTIKKSNAIHVKINGDGAPVSKYQSFVTISITLVEFAENIHATGEKIIFLFTPNQLPKELNFDILYAKASESILDMKKYYESCINEIQSLNNGERFSFAGPDGESFSLYILPKHTNDFKWNYNALGPVLRDGV